eukprot:c4135_g1_i1.p1 GENE.c4135_g1_i1~~c4135_g1_i1.p1  ORF type:complete len:673 (+),score=124.51 c4135_g1_i1:2-2020(+)
MGFFNSSTDGVMDKAVFNRFIRENNVALSVMLKNKMLTDGQVSWNEFVQESSADSSIRQFTLNDVFNAFESTSPAQGLIDRSQVLSAFGQLLGRPVSMEFVLERLHHFDSDKSGTIDFEEFVEMTTGKQLSCASTAREIFLRSSDTIEAELLATVPAQKHSAFSAWWSVVRRPITLGQFTAWIFGPDLAFSKSWVSFFSLSESEVLAFKGLKPTQPLVTTFGPDVEALKDAFLTRATEGILAKGEFLEFCVQNNIRIPPIQKTQLLADGGVTWQKFGDFMTNNKASQSRLNLRPSVAVPDQREEQDDVPLVPPVSDAELKLVHPQIMELREAFFLNATAGKMSRKQFMAFVRQQKIDVTVTETNVLLADSTVEWLEFAQAMSAKLSKPKPVESEPKALEPEPNLNASPQIEESPDEENDEVPKLDPTRHWSPEEIKQDFMNQAKDGVLTKAEFKEFLRSHNITLSLIQKGMLTKPAISWTEFAVEMGYEGQDNKRSSLRRTSLDRQSSSVTDKAREGSNERAPVQRRTSQERQPSQPEQAPVNRRSSQERQQAARREPLQHPEHKEESHIPVRRTSQTTSSTEERSQGAPVNRRSSQERQSTSQISPQQAENPAPGQRRTSQTQQTPSQASANDRVPVQRRASQEQQSVTQPTAAVRRQSSQTGKTVDKAKK